MPVRTPGTTPAVAAARGHIAVGWLVDGDFAGRPAVDNITAGQPEDVRPVSRSDCDAADRERQISQRRGRMRVDGA